MLITAELRDWVHHHERGVLTGEIFNDTKGRWKDGHRIRTSDVLRIEHDVIGELLIITLFSVYKCKLTHRSTDYRRVVCDYLKVNEK